MKIIYDFGANNGDNIPYYLLKSDLVVAVEANPDLSNNIKKRFEKEIINKKLVVLNYVISTERKKEDVDFFIHKTNNHLSRTSPPNNKINNFNKIKIW